MTLPLEMQQVAGVLEVREFRIGIPGELGKNLQSCGSQAWSGHFFFSRLLFPQQDPQIPLKSQILQM